MGAVVEEVGVEGCWGGVSIVAFDYGEGRGEGIGSGRIFKNLDLSLWEGQNGSGQGVHGWCSSCAYHHWGQSDLVRFRDGPYYRTDCLPRPSQPYN